MEKRYNIFIFMGKEDIIIIMKNLNYIININNEENDSLLKELIEGEKRSLEELKEAMEWRKLIGKEINGKYKILSGSVEEIIGEIREIFLLGEII